MRDITVLVTASGAPGTAALLRALRQNGERGVRIVGTDMSPQAIGRHFCDRFYVVPPGKDPAFADALVDVVRRENIDAILPQSSHDLQALADSRDRFLGTTVLVSPPEAIQRRTTRRRPMHSSSDSVCGRPRGGG
jgi:Carbamoylphosphate synthase large subunit (split gene in MJ)